MNARPSRLAERERVTVLHYDGDYELIAQLQQRRRSAVRRWWPTALLLDAFFVFRIFGAEDAVHDRCAPRIAGTITYRYTVQ